MAERSSDLILSALASDAGNSSASKIFAFTTWVGLFFAMFFITRLFLRSVFFDCFDPEFQGQIFASRVAEVRTKLLLVAVAKELEIERDGTSQVSHIGAVTFNIAFEFCKSEIVWIKRHQAQVSKRSGKHLLKATFVFVGWLRNSHPIQIHPIFQK